MSLAGAVTVTELEDILTKTMNAHPGEHSVDRFLTKLQSRFPVKQSLYVCIIFLSVDSSNDNLGVQIDSAKYQMLGMQFLELTLCFSKMEEKCRGFAAVLIILQQFASRQVKNMAVSNFLEQQMYRVSQSVADFV